MILYLSFAPLLGFKPNQANNLNVVLGSQAV